MKQETIGAIYELLETIKEAAEWLSGKENEQLNSDIVYGRKEIEELLRTEANCPVNIRIEADTLSHVDWLQEMYRVLDDIEYPLKVQNNYDKEFLQLIGYIWRTDVKSLTENMIGNMQRYKSFSKDSYEKLVEYYAKYSFWGPLVPENEDYSAFELRAKVLKHRSYEFLWLYKRLEDYMSKRTLYCILLNWTVLDTDQLVYIKSPFADYYEPDIFPDNQGDVFVDVGAYVGDSINNYIQIYGNRYAKIFAYEISEETCEILRKTTKKFHDVIVRQKGAGCEKGTMFLMENADSSANTVEKQVLSMGKEVEIVQLDEELLNEGVTFIKMDIEGAEQNALLGCRQIIKKNHPKLAICTYHGYEDLWKIPSMIDEMNPQYKFYMRHYGGNLIPTEFVLLCKDA